MNKKIFALLLIFSLSPSAHAAYRNILRPFSTDGCSNFPDGNPLGNKTLWLRCCVEHDITYWHGGTADERLQADNTLHSCVANSSGSVALADAVYGAVRAGGYPGLPTSTGWGKGWTLPRGYAPLTSDEMRQVTALYPKIPENINDQILETRPMIRPGYSLTGDHCLDKAIVQIEARTHTGVEILETKDETREGAEGWTKKLSLLTAGCTEPYQFEFLLLRKSACTDDMNELLMRGRIRLKNIIAPKSCALSRSV